MNQRNNRFYREPPGEFDCIECGRHIIALPYDIHGKQTCATCLSIPGWFRDPELRQRLDPDMEEPK